MKIVVVTAYIHNWKSGACTPIVVVAYPERLHPFVQERVYYWKQEEEERIQQLDPGAYEHSIAECGIEELARKGDTEPSVTKELMEEITGEDQMTRVLWSVFPRDDKHFLLEMIMRAYEQYLKGDDQETIEFFPVGSKEHGHGGHY